MSEKYILREIKKKKRLPNIQIVIYDLFTYILICQSKFGILLRCICVLWTTTKCWWGQEWCGFRLHFCLNKSNTFWQWNRLHVKISHSNHTSYPSTNYNRATRKCNSCARIVITIYVMCVYMCMRGDGGESVYLNYKRERRW